MPDLGHAIARLHCRITGHVAPPEPREGTIAAMLRSMSGRYCQRCRARMPGDPPTPIERMIRDLVGTAPIYQPAPHPVAGGAIVYQEEADRA